MKKILSLALIFLLLVIHSDSFAQSSTMKSSPCKKCNGKGYTNVQCSECKNGLVMCNKCQGKGYDYYGPCTSCGGNGRLVCWSCGGSGKIKKTCNSCDGGGEIQYEYLVPKSDSLLTSNSDMEKVNTLFVIGTKLFTDNKFKECIEVFDSVLTLQPNLAYAYYNRGNAKFFIGKMEEGCKDLYLAIANGARSKQDVFDSKCKTYEVKITNVKNKNAQHSDIAVSKSEAKPKNEYSQHLAVTLYKSDHWLDVKSKGGFSQAWHSPTYEKVEIQETKNTFKVTLGSKFYRYTIVERKLFSERMMNNTVILDGQKYILHVAHNLDGTYSISIDGLWMVPSITNIQIID